MCCNWVIICSDEMCASVGKQVDASNFGKDFEIGSLGSPLDFSQHEDFLLYRFIFGHIDCRKRSFVNRGMQSHL